MSKLAVKGRQSTLAHLPAGGVHRAPRLYGWFSAAVLVTCFLAVGTAKAQQLPDFTSLVEEASPAVVNISTTQRVQAPQRPRLPPGMEIPDLPEGMPFGELFRHFFGEGEAPPREFDSRSLGSGFVISPDGYVLSNYHVIRDADEIIVRLSDRREFIAEVIGSDERSDIALLKIPADDLPTVRMGASNSLKVGSWVLAIGSPFGFEHSVTAGIVSAKGRSLPRDSYVPFIQTDVAINPGNSGGPLFNLDGEVVGINSQIYSRTGGFMGLSFAIPIEVAIDVAEQLRERGHVVRGWLGVLIQDVTRELAESFQMPRPEGALVAQVLPGSPAEAAGVQVGDVITDFAGQEVVRSSDLPPIVGSTKVGSRVPLQVVRGGEATTLEVEIAALPEEDEQRVAEARPKTVVENRLGLEVGELTEEQREQLELREHGVIVTRVHEGPASNAGVRRGDVIVGLNGVEVRDAEHFDELVSELPAGRSVPLLVQRGTGPMFLALQVPEQEK
jgi:serine protease Do